MPDSRTFDWAADVLEKQTSLSRLQARGVVRSLVKKAGLEAGSLAPGQLRVLAAGATAAELFKKHGIEEGERIAQLLTACPENLADGRQESSVEAIFSRLGG